MIGQQRVPLVRSRVSLSPARSKTNIRLLTVVLTVLGLMVFYISIRIRIDETVRDNLRLTETLRQLDTQNQALQAEETGLSDFGRVIRLAEELGMVVIPNENIEAPEK